MVNSNLEELDGFKATNGCVDPLTQVNVPKVSNDLINAVSTLNVLHYIIWACAIVTLLEFIWIVR